MMWESRACSFPHRARPNARDGEEAISAGFNETEGVKTPRIQILTVTAAQIIHGERPRVAFNGRSISEQAASIAKRARAPASRAPLLKPQEALTRQAARRRSPRPKWRRLPCSAIFAIFIPLFLRKNSSVPCVGNFRRNRSISFAFLRPETRESEPKTQDSLYFSLMAGNQVGREARSTKPPTHAPPPPRPARL